jgi:hypothetical protein
MFLMSQRSTVDACAEYAWEVHHRLRKPTYPEVCFVCSALVCCFEWCIRACGDGVSVGCAGAFAGVVRSDDFAQRNQSL